MSERMLPSAFAELEEFAPIWCLATENERWEKRTTSTMGAMQEFCDAFFPRLEEAIDHCDKFDLNELPEDVLNLLRLVYSLVMVSMAVEIMHQPVPVDSADAVMVRSFEPLP
ncbi:hypothetical protein GTV32_10965 [Gordonia sp. SID5947]|uniref:hypothetical protein n=1 Tax=Gordonia sp. SID5947 TaxID=2690315 RepID=UPI0013A86626|nr:hypothetical protein [Gordonia sp. SID5947]MYR06793.1 hypothetical protein [Gordonia sp. SID5947]